METTRDRITVAELHGAASRHADQWKHPVGEDRQDALEELRGIADGRKDLLAEVAGVLLGCHPPGDPTHEHAEIAVSLLKEAGADLDQIERWRLVGQTRGSRPMPGPNPAAPRTVGSGREHRAIRPEPG